MPSSGTIKQKKAAKYLVENGSTVAEAMRKAGYSENTLRDPGKLTRSKAFAEYLVEAGLTDSVISTRYKELVDSNQLDRIVFPHKLIYKEVTKKTKKGKKKVETITQTTPLTDEEITNTISEIVGAKLISIQRTNLESIATVVVPLHPIRKGGIELVSKIRGDFAPEAHTVHYELTPEEKVIYDKIYNMNKK